MKKPTRSGSSLVEILVAIVLFATGVLALASSSAVVIRSLQVAGATTMAANIATSRLAQIAASRCGSAGSGSAIHPGGVTETWHTLPASNGLVRATVNVTFARPPRTSDFESVVSCG